MDERRQKSEIMFSLPFLLNFSDFTFVSQTFYFQLKYASYQKLIPDITQEVRSGSWKGKYKVIRSKETKLNINCDFQSQLHIILDLSMTK